MNTSKTVDYFEFLAIMERRMILGKFHPNKAIAKAYKDTSNIVWEDLCLEFLKLMVMDKCLNKTHSNTWIPQADNNTNKIFLQ